MKSRKKKPTRVEARAWGERLIDDTYEKLHALIDAQHRAIERRDALLADHEKLWKTVHDALHHLTEVWRYLAKQGLVETEARVVGIPLGVYREPKNSNRRRKTKRA